MDMKQGYRKVPEIDVDFPENYITRGSSSSSFKPLNHALRSPEAQKHGTHWSNLYKIKPPEVQRGVSKSPRVLGFACYVVMLQNNVMTFVVLYHTPNEKRCRYRRGVLVQQHYVYLIVVSKGTPTMNIHVTYQQMHQPSHKAPYRLIRSMENLSKC